MRKINKIILHCSATPEGRHVTVEHIDQWHKQKGWKGIGYHYVIYLDGSVHAGRSVQEQGAHCTGQNKYSIGVCYIGGCAKDGKTSKDTRTDKQKQALTELLKALKKKYPGAKIYGHYEFAAKDCPCFDVKEYDNL